MNITIILVIMTGIISFQAFNNASIKGKLLFYPVSINNNGEWYRFLTSGFIHADWQHLIINMIVLYQFGEVVEYMFSGMFGEMMGRIAYILLYLSSIVISSIPSYFKHQHNPGYAALGASGATSALVFAYIIFNPWGWFLFPPLPAVLFGVAYLWYSSYMEKRGMDNIGHNVHFWGAIYGFVFTIITIIALQPNMLQVFMNRLLEGPTGFMN